MITYTSLKANRGEVGWQVSMWSTDLQTTSSENLGLWCTVM